MLELPVDALRQYLSYDPITGAITNKASRRGARVGDEAGCSRGHGYKKIFFMGRYYYYHRVAWAIHYGEQPPLIVDHADGDGENNSIGNLRGATHRQNIRNQKRRSDNTTGLKGVSFNKRARKFVATISMGGKSSHLGLFASKEEAHAAYCTAAAGAFHEFARSA